MLRNAGKPFEGFLIGKRHDPIPILKMSLWLLSEIRQVEVGGQIRCAAVGRRLGGVQVGVDNGPGKGAGCQG